MANGVRDYKSLTENSLLQITSDHYDAIQIISRCPECFQAYKSHIQKKRAQVTIAGNTINLQEGGLTADNSQQNPVMLNGVTTTTR